MSFFLNLLEKIKYIFSIIALLILNIGWTQDARIPFRVGNNFGLSDKNGQLKIPAIYEKMRPLKDGFFQTEITRLDTIKNYLGEKTTKIFTATGLLYQDQAIIENQTYREFRFYEDNEFIVGFDNV